MQRSRCCGDRDLARVIAVCKNFEIHVESVLLQRARVRKHVKPGVIPGGFTAMVSYLAWFERVTMMLDGDSLSNTIKAFEILGKRERATLAPYAASVVGLLIDENDLVRKQASAHENNIPLSCIIDCERHVRSHHGLTGQRGFD